MILINYNGFVKSLKVVTPVKIRLGNDNKERIHIYYKTVNSMSRSDNLL